MLSKITYEQVKNLLLEHFEEKHKGYDVEVVCKQETYSIPDGFGFDDEYHRVGGFLKISKTQAITILGKEEKITSVEKRDFKKGEIFEIVSKALEKDNLKLEYMFARKENIEIVFDIIEPEAKLVKCIGK